MLHLDLTQPALCAVALISCTALLTQWRAIRRMRQVVQRDLERIFEQVDLLRLDNQQEQPAALIPTVLPASLPLLDRSIGHAAALELAAGGADESEITLRCGLSAAEARILVAMRGMQARARAPH